MELSYIKNSVRFMHGGYLCAVLEIMLPAIPCDSEMPDKIKDTFNSFYVRVSEAYEASVKSSLPCPVFDKAKLPDGKKKEPRRFVSRIKVTYSCEFGCRGKEKKKDNILTVTRHVKLSSVCGNFEKNTVDVFDLKNGIFLK